MSDRSSKRAGPRASETTSAPARVGTLRELAFVYGWTALVTASVSYSGLPLTRSYGHLILAGFFLGTTFYLARRQQVTLAHYGTDLSGLLESRALPNGEPEPLGDSLRRALPELARELGFAVLCSLIVFPPFVLAFRLWHDVDVPFTLHLPHDPLDFVLGQLIVVALPEEVLFRGYFQTVLSSHFPRRQRILGTDVSLAALSCQALLFALLHFLVGLDPTRLSVFFPALAFGWLRERRGGIGAAIWFHAFCNVLSEVLARGYL